MAYFTSYLELTFWNVHEAKIRDVVYDDIWSKIARKDIDVYLSPLIEDLKLMWDQGVEIFDRFGNENFKMHAMIFCTINDILKYGNLSGYNVKDHKACPICEEDTASQQLKHGRKTINLRPQRFLKSHHPYRMLKKAF